MHQDSVALTQGRELEEDVEQIAAGMRHQGFCREISEKTHVPGALPAWLVICQAVAPGCGLKRTHWGFTGTQFKFRS